MTDIAGRIVAYPALSDAERAEVDAFVAAHPEWHEAWVDACRLADLLDAAEGPPHGLADRAAGPTGEALPPEVASFAERLRWLDAEAADPARHLDTLTGRTPTAPSARRPRERPVARVPRVARWVTRGLMLATVALGALLGGSVFSVSERDRVADLASVTEEQVPTLRGADAQPLPERYDAALAAVADARRTTLGLFPRVDSAALEAAALDLAGIVEEAPEDSWISEGARLAMGRVRLVQRRDAEAAHLLAGVVRQGGDRAPEARRLLDWLRAQS